MTGRERLVLAARGGEVDRQAVILWGSWDDRADGCVVELHEIQPSDETATLALVHSPFTRALRAGLDLNELLARDPAKGNALLDQMVNQTEADIESALEAGADGVAYLLDGAYPAATTPMQYGGYYLERDRELLERFQGARFNLIFVEGTDEVYLDSVSDLAAHAIGWRVAETGFTLAMMRELRPSALASFEPGAEIRLVGTVTELESVLTQTTLHEASV